MIESTLTILLRYHLGFIIGFFLTEYYFKGEFKYVNLLITINIFLCTLISNLNDKLTHLNKLNEVHKTQLQNRKLFDEIFKLNNIYNQRYKKDN